jgi:glycosyltransferase involved in cell wall biosynthesis
MSKKKVLFISHDTSRTGAPIVLLHFLKWFKAHTDIPFQILLRNNGELAPEFAALAPVSILNNNPFNQIELFEKVYRNFGMQKINKKVYLSNLKKQLVRDNIALIYSNTITNNEVLEGLASLNCPVISHVHELESWIQRTGLENFKWLQNHTQHYIAVAEAVKNNLVFNHKIPEDRVDTVHEFIPTQPPNLNIQPQVRQRICQQLNIPSEALIVGASGTTDWRKGPDLFIQLARAVYQRSLDTPVYFLWVGGESQGIRFFELWHDVKNVGLEKYIHFLGMQSNPLDYFAAFDVFALMSREDPFPLVCLEAASLGKPIICFDGAGGEKEFVENDCGFVVPYLDIEAMASKVTALLKFPELRQQLGIRAAQKVRERHDLEVVAPKIVEIIKRFLQGCES